MNSLEFNKIVGAGLGALVFAFGLNAISGALFHVGAPETPGFVVQTASAAGTAGPAEPAKPFAELLASADVAKGQAAAKKCAACHDFTNGGPNKVGPNNWGIVGRDIGKHEGFKYSKAMEEFGAAHGQWSYDLLNAFITNPKAEVPGTAMAFAGIKNDTERANLIAYLRTLSDSPAPLPAADAPAAAPAAQ